MRQILIIATVVLGLASSALAQEVDFPYTAIVLNDGTKVHSGPGDSHYATHELKENELVEVYRHDPGGWCAVRPPAKSFSMIPEQAVKKLGNGVAEILADGSQAWVGTVLGPVDKPLWQVKLKKGERVAIVGQASWPHPSGKSVVWLQIEPPAGEYRWVRIDDLQLPPAKDEVKKVDYSEPPAFRSRSQKRRVKAKPTSSIETKPSFKPASPKKKFGGTAKEFEGESFAKVPASGSGWKAATRPIPKPELAPPQYSGTFRSVGPIPSSVSFPSADSEVEQVSFVDQEPSDPRFESWTGSSVPPADNRTAPPERFASLESMDRQARSLVRERNEPAPSVSESRSTRNTNENSVLMKIEDQLSSEMLKDPQSWNFSELKFQTERAKARCNDPVERLALQHVLEKIARCDQLRKGYQQASPFAVSANPSVTTVPQNQGYDATGWLKKLASSSGSIDPTYVLQDSLGNVTHQVAGTTGMNLGQYVDRQVGVFGRRGVNQRLKLDHVTVERVVVLR